MHAQSDIRVAYTAADNAIGKRKTGSKHAAGLVREAGRSTKKGTDKRHTHTHGEREGVSGGVRAKQLVVVVVVVVVIIGRQAAAAAAPEAARLHGENS